MFAFCREHTVNEREYQTVSSIFETLFEEVEPDVLEGGAENYLGKALMEVRNFLQGRL